MSVDELAEWLGLDRNTIYHWRVRGIGPCAIRVGDGTRGSLRYRRSDVEAWLKSREDRAATARRQGITNVETPRRPKGGEPAVGGGSQ